MSAPLETLQRAPISLMAHRTVINYIHGELMDDKYHSKWQRRRMVRSAIVRERVSAIQ